MFNEAFMFFWLVQLAENLATTMFVVGLIAGFASIPVVMEFDRPKLAIKFVVFGLFMMFSAVFVPPKEAFYAGAAQYVGEAGELDQTLLDLKRLLDQKIAELSDTE